MPDIRVWVICFMTYIRHMGKEAFANITITVNPFMLTYCAWGKKST